MPRGCDPVRETREASPEKMRLELRAEDGQVREGSMCQGPVAGGSRESEGLKKASVVGEQSKDSKGEMRQERWVRSRLPRAFQSSIKSFDHAVRKVRGHKIGGSGVGCWVVVR